MAEEREDLYVKYRVFREPAEALEHPTPMIANYAPVPPTFSAVAEEVKEFVFVLKPDTDPHAVTALATYAAAIRDDKPQLAADLRTIVEEYR